MSDIRALTREFIARHLRDHAMSDNDDMFAAGYINSLFVMQLVLFVEKNFAVTVADEDLEMDNFRSINAITSFVARKQTKPTENGQAPRLDTDHVDIKRA
jgi:methoxymalonate biosynthesis acyl carrier protein